METGAELNQRRDAAVNGDHAFGRSGNAGDALEERAFAGTVAANHSVGATLRHREGHALERLERFIRIQIAEETPVEDCRLQSGELS